MEKVRRRLASLTVGQGRSNDNPSYPRPQAEVEDNVHHGVYQRGTGHEEIVGRTHHCTNTEEGALGSNGTILRVRSRSPGMGRGS